MTLENAWTYSPQLKPASSRNGWASQPTLGTSIVPHYENTATNKNSEPCHCKIEWDIVNPSNHILRLFIVVIAITASLNRVEPKSQIKSNPGITQVQV